MTSTVGFVNKPQGISLEQVIVPARAVKARTHVVIDETKVLADYLAFTPRLIYRRSDDDHAHEKSDATRFVEEMHAVTPPGVILHLGNEPGRGSLDALNNWSLEAMKACDRLERKGVIFNFETGNPEPSDWPRLSGAVQYAYDHGHFVGLHEYFDVAVARSLKWHVGRFKFLINAFGTNTPRIIITELGCAVNYNPYAGWQTVHVQETYAPEIDAAMAEYATYDIDALVYLLGYWDKSATFDCRGQQVIFDRMTAINTRTQEEDEVAVWGLKRVQTKTAGAAINMRSEPKLTAPVLRTVKTGDYLRPYGTPVNANGHSWQRVNDENCKTGWVSLNVLKLV